MPTGEHYSIFLLINSFRTGGAETVNLDLAIEFARRGIQAHLIILKGNGVPFQVPSGVKIHHMHLDGISPRHIRSEGHPAVRKLSQLFSATGSGERLQAALGAISSLSLANKLLSFFPAEKVVFWLHFPVTYSDLQNKNFIRKLIRKRRLSKLYKSMKITIPSKAAKCDFEGIFGSGHSRIHSIYNSLSPRRISTLASQPIEQRIADSSELDGDYWVHAGRFVGQKRHDRLLHAFKLFCDKVNSDLKLVCLGDGELRDEIRELAKTLGIAHRVIFPGYLANPYPVVRKAKAFILSSDFETLPTVLLEALSLGVPCVSVNCPTGPEEILVGKLSNFLTEMNPESLADGMCRVWENPPDISGYDFSRFDPKVVAQQYIDLLQEG